MESRKIISVDNCEGLTLATNCAKNAIEVTCKHTAASDFFIGLSATHTAKLIIC